MKRYIKASYDSSMPEWLKGQQILDDLKQHYALAEAKFYNKPQDNSIVIYLLKSAYINTVKRNWYTGYKTTEHTAMVDYAWSPESTQDISILVGDRYIRIDSEINMNKLSVKEAFKHNIKRKTYMVAPLRSDIRSEHYEDPRDMGADAYPLRDKSGYVIPDPQELYERLYAKFPDKSNDKLEDVGVTLEDYYNVLNECKDKVFNIDIRKGRGYGDNLGANRINLGAFNKVVTHYGWAYADFEKLISSGSDPKILSKLIQSVDRLGTEIDELVNLLNEE